MCVCVCVWLCASTIGTLNFSQNKEKTRLKRVGRNIQIQFPNLLLFLLSLLSSALTGKEKLTQYDNS